MSDNELLLAISDLMEKKLNPINERQYRMEVLMENEILPRLQNIESCYTSTYRRYAGSVEEIDAMRTDIEIMKSVIQEHGEKIRRIS